MKATQFDIFKGNGKVKEASAAQIATLGPSCVEALFRYNRSRTRISEEARAARKRAYYAETVATLRSEMVAAYGSACLKCGETDPIVLLLDHIRDDAQLDRKQNRHAGGWTMYLRLKKMGWPKDRYQLLCHNCNYRKEYDRRKRKCLPHQ